MAHVVWNTPGVFKDGRETMGGKKPMRKKIWEKFICDIESGKDVVFQMVQTFLREKHEVKNHREKP